MTIREQAPVDLQDRRCPATEIYMHLAVSRCAFAMARSPICQAVRARQFEHREWRIDTKSIGGAGFFLPHLPSGGHDIDRDWPDRLRLLPLFRNKAGCRPVVGADHGEDDVLHAGDGIADNPAIVLN